MVSVRLLRLFRLPTVRLPTAIRRRARRNRLLAMAITLATVLAAAAVVALAGAYVVYKPPGAVLQLLARRYPDVLWQVTVPAGAAGRVVALTLDDAPSEHTRAILAELAAARAHATFFVIGAQADEPGGAATLRDAVAAGHELGNHAMYDRPSAALADAQLRDELAAVQARLTRAYDDAAAPAPPPRLFRPGSGFFSTRMRRLLRRLGYRLVLGSVYPHDPQIALPAVNAAHILSMVRPGAIIICHDRRAWTVPMLRTVLPELARRGYRVLTVSELLAEAKVPPLPEV